MGNLFKTLFGASNAKALITFLVGLAASVAVRFGLHWTPDDTNAVLVVTLFVSGFFVQDGSVGNWRSSLTGLIGAVFYLVGRLGFHLPPDIQAGAIAISGAIISWLRVPGGYNPGPEPIPKRVGT